MLKRVLSSLVGIPLLLVCVFWRGGLPFSVGIAIVALLAVGEFYAACDRQGTRPHALLGMATVALLLGATASAAAGGDRWVGPLLTGLILVSLTAELTREKRAPVVNVGATLLGVLYAGWLFRFVILLRLQGAALLAGSGGHLLPALPAPVADPGAWVVLLVVAATWTADTAAFFTGRAWGTRKLAPAISPGKTVEGTMGGLAGAVLVAFLVGVLLLGLEARLAVGLGVLIGLLSPVGDLCESALKRELGVKDFGRLLPGHGGILDRFDSLLMTAPVVYTVLQWLRHGS
jgi:phosphatidate cytidylyltransferase